MGVLRETGVSYAKRFRSHYHRCRPGGDIHGARAGRYRDVHPDLEKGLDIRERIALNKNRQAKAADRYANIVSGWGGAGAFSDGKLTLTTDYGGNLDDYMNKGELAV